MACTQLLHNGVLQDVVAWMAEGLDGKNTSDSADSRFPMNLNQDSKRQEEQEEASETDRGVRS